MQDTSPAFLFTFGAPMEIALKVPLVEKKYSTVAMVLIGLRYTLLAGGILFAFFADLWPVLAMLGAFMIFASLPLYIINSLFRNYKTVGEIVFGYHSIRVNGAYYAMKDIQKIFGKFEREDGRPRIKVMTVQGENNHICFYAGDVRQYHRVLLNIRDMEALDFLIKKWEELYGLKMGRFYNNS